MVSSKTVVAIALAALTVIVLFAVAPFVGQTIDDIDSTQDDTVATTTVTLGAGSLATETLNLSTETYTIADAHGGAFVVGNGTAAQTSANLTTEITANSTLFTAVDNTGTVTVTTILKGTEMNGYTSTTNITGGSVTGATFAGAVDGSDWSPDTNTDLDTPAENWSTFQGLVVLAFLGVIIGIVIGAFKKMGDD